MPIRCIVFLQIVAFHTPYSIVGVLPFFSSLIGRGSYVLELTLLHSGH